MMASDQLVAFQSVFGYLIMLTALLTMVVFCLLVITLPRSLRLCVQIWRLFRQELLIVRSPLPATEDCNSQWTSTEG